MTRSASPFSDSASADVEVERVPLSSAIEDEKLWVLGESLEADAEERVGVKLRLRDLQESCRVKKWIVPESVVEAANLAVGLVDITVATSPGVADVTDSHSDDLIGSRPLRGLKSFC